MRSVSGAFAERSVDQLEVIVPEISCSSSVKVVVLSEEHKRLCYKAVYVLFSLIFWVGISHHDEGERWLSRNRDLAPYSTLSFLLASLQSLQQTSSCL